MNEINLKICVAIDESKTMHFLINGKIENLIHYTTQELTQEIDDCIGIEHNKYISQSAVTESKMDRTSFILAEYCQKNIKPTIRLIFVKMFDPLTEWIGNSETK